MVAWSLSLSLTIIIILLPFGYKVHPVPGCQESPIRINPLGPCLGLTSLVTQLPVGLDPPWTLHP